MLAIGAGGLDVAVAMGGGPFYLTCPKVIGVELTGKLDEWVTGKDVILKLLSILTTKGNVGCVVEYFGSGVANLSVPERATITNMGAELGVTTSVFPSDERTQAYLEFQEREDKYEPLRADPEAPYDKSSRLTCRNWSRWRRVRRRRTISHQFLRLPVAKFNRSSSEAVRIRAILT